MLGAIIGDTIGSVFEFNKTKETDFPLFNKATRFTDDTVLTVATAYAIMHNKDFAVTYKQFALLYPNRGYGGNFGRWFKSATLLPAYDSWGNGSAMRVSPIGLAFSEEKKVLEQARKSSECTHNHIEGIKGAQAIALAVYYANKGFKKGSIKNAISRMFDYDLDRTVDSIRPSYSFEVSCQKSVPEAIIAFLDSTSYEDAIRLAISLGGDSDTLACMTGSIAEAYYEHIPDRINERVWEMLPVEFQTIVSNFYKKYGLTDQWA